MPSQTAIGGFTSPLPVNGGASNPPGLPRAPASPLGGAYAEGGAWPRLASALTWPG